MSDAGEYPDNILVLLLCLQPVGGIRIVRRGKGLTIRQTAKADVVTHISLEQIIFVLNAISVPDR